MLVLTAKVGEPNDEIVITVAGITFTVTLDAILSRNKARLRFDAPSEVKIMRRKLLGAQADERSS